MNEKFYNIHNIVKFRILNDPKFSWKFNNIHKQYENFESDPLNDLDFTVYLGNFSPNSKDCYIIEDKYYIKEDYFFCITDSYKFAKWKFEMSGFESGDTIIRIFSNLIGYMAMSGFIIDFMIHYKLNEKGYPLLHASCISKDNNGFLFAARGGAGKTTIALNFTGLDFKFLGDNFVILHDGNVTSFLTPLSIFTYNLTPLIEKNLGMKSKLTFGFKKLLYKLTLNYIKIFTKINVKNVFSGSIIDKTKLNGIFLLITKDVFEVKEISKDELIDHLVLNQKIDLIYFLQYIIEFSYIFPNSNMAKHWEKYKNNLNKNVLNDTAFYKIEVPLRYNSSIFEKLLKLMKGVY